jgi:Kdo2-lipid IVA lauroyltransferase/acyltransferase
MITYYIVMPVLYFLAFLPTGWLYAVSDFFAFILYYVVRYRKQVVFNNLRNSFPEKSEAEITAIAKQSYKNLADRAIENIKCISISRAEIIKRIPVKNQHLLSDLYNQKRNVVLVLGHIGSWEFATYRLSTLCDYKLYGLVSLVSNPYFNRMIQTTRGKMGMHLITMQESRAFSEKELKDLSLVAFIADQSPRPERAYWTTFLNQETGFFTGAERYAKAHNCAVIYGKVSQTKRGYYNGEFIHITDNAALEPDNFVTEKFVRLLENQIKELPADWLWSHKRWKHKKPHNQRQIKTAGFSDPAVCKKLT